MAAESSGATRTGAPKHLGAWRRWARDRLAAAGIENAAGETDLILRHVLGLRAVDVILQRDRVLEPGARRRLSRLLTRRTERVPLQYLLGEVEFRGLSLRVSQAVLIPRPETEGLVEKVLAAIAPAEPAVVADVGTGSGAIALALVAERPQTRVLATDVSPAALRVARGNARRLGLANRVRFLLGDLTEPLERVAARGSLQAVVSNPPYVSLRDRRRLAPEIREHEPATALFAGAGGLAVIRRLVPKARQLLEPGGLLALEIGEDQGGRVRELLRRGGWSGVRIEKDLTGRCRYALARKV